MLHCCTVGMSSTTVKTPAGKKKRPDESPKPSKKKSSSVCDLDLTFDLDVVTLIYKILSKLYLGNRKVLEVDTW